MNPPRATLYVLLGTLALCAVLSPAPVVAQPFPVTPVFQVNTYTEGYQGGPVLASNGNGRFVVAWESGFFDEESPQDGDDSGVYAQVYDGSGARIGGEIPVNQTTAGYQGQPAVAMDEEGGFVTVWVSETPGSFETRVLARRFAPAGAPLGNELEVSDAALPPFSVFQPDVAMDGEGRFVVTWTLYDSEGFGSEIYARRFDAAGSPLGAPFRVSGAEEIPEGPAVAMGPAGDFSVIYEVFSGVGPDGRLLARRFTASGEPVGDAVALDDPPRSRPLSPQAATRPDGSLVVTWSDVGAIFGRVLDPSGAPRGPAFQVNAREGDFDMPQVAVDAAGGFLIAWTDYEDEGSGVVLGQRFDASGARQGAELRLGRGSGIPLGDGALLLGISTVVTISPNGDFVVARTASPQQGHEGSDGSGEGVFARIFRLPPFGADACAASGGHLVCDVRRDGGDPDLDLQVAAQPGDVPLVGNLDGDVRDDLCLYRDGRFLCDVAHDGGAPEVTIAFGGAAVDIPLLGDVNGDGRDDACVRRRRRFLCDTAHNGGTAEIQILFGRPADVPLLGDVDGDGDDDPCLYRAGRFSCDTVHDGQTAEVVVSFGSGRDVPLLGDVDKDGDDDFCIFTGERFLCDTAHDGGAAELEIPFAGPAGTVPLLGDLDGF